MCHFTGTAGRTCRSGAVAGPARCSSGWASFLPAQAGCLTRGSPQRVQRTRDVQCQELPAALMASKVVERCSDGTCSVKGAQCRIMCLSAADGGSEQNVAQSMGRYNGKAGTQPLAKN